MPQVIQILKSGIVIFESSKSASVFIDKAAIPPIMPPKSPNAAELSLFINSSLARSTLKISSIPNFFVIFLS